MAVVKRRTLLRARLRSVFGSILSRPTSNQSSRRGAKIIGSVVHTTESSDGSFDGIISFFRRSGAQASAHYVIDAIPQRGRRYVRVAQMVPESRKAWTALSANPYVVQYELIGRAKRTRREWLTTYRAQLDTLAVLIADDALQYGFPVRRALPGIVGHVDLPRFGFPQSHWDPGPGFPWDQFLIMVKHAQLLAIQKPPVSQVPVPRSRRRVSAHKAE